MRECGSSCRCRCHYRCLCHSNTICFPFAVNHAVLPWGLYFFDKVREATLHTWRGEAKLRPVLGDDPTPTSVVYTNKDGQATAIKLVIEGVRDLRVSAGQWMYICVPKISPVQVRVWQKLASTRVVQTIVTGENLVWLQHHGQFFIISCLLAVSPLFLGVVLRERQRGVSDRHHCRSE